MSLSDIKASYEIKELSVVIQPLPDEQGRIAAESFCFLEVT